MTNKEHPATSHNANSDRGADRNPATEKAADSFLLAVYLARIAPSVPAYTCCIDAARIIGRAKRLSSLAVAACNYELSQRQETRRENLRLQITEIAALYGIKAECTGDPRGYVVRLHHKDMARNGWGEGFGVA